MFLLLSMNVIAILPRIISVIILPRYLIFIITVLEVPPMVTFFQRERTLCGMVYTVCFNGAKIWNNIPLEIRSSTSVANFKKTLKNSFWSFIAQNVICLFSAEISAGGGGSGV